MKKYTAVLLAAGQGTRMKSARPKVLHEAAGLPMIAWPILALREAGINKIVVVGGPQMDGRLREAVGEDVLLAEQAERLGTGHAVMQAAPYLQEDGYVVILPGDMPLVTADTIQKVCGAAEEQNCACVVLTALYDDPTGYGRVIRDSEGCVLRIVEEANASAEEKQVREANAFVYCIKAPLLVKYLKELVPKPPKSEYYLTDVVELLIASGEKVGAVTVDAQQCLGVNDRVQLAQVSALLRGRIAKAHMENGVTLIDPGNTYIDAHTKIGRDTVIYPGVVLEESEVGEDVILYPGSRIYKSVVKDGCTVQNSVLLESEVGEKTTVGPYAYLRPGTRIAAGCRIGDFVEVKNSVVGAGTKLPHLSYIGDADLGEKINVGCGTVFVNYDGKRKHRTVVEDGVFIGCNSNLVAPVRVGEGAYIAAGSTITDDVPPHTLAIARSRQVIKTEWKDKRNEE